MYFVVWISIAMLLPFSNASHFRGGTISWEHLGKVGDTHQVEFSFRLGWRRDSSLERCDNNTVANQTQAYGFGHWYLYNASSFDFPRSTEIICTSYDLGENWAYGFNTFQANITSEDSLYVSFSGYAWIGSLAFGAHSSWSVAALGIDFSVRSDTGEVNHPPSTLSSPVIRLQLGCPTTIKINAVDKDNDDVFCRYATTFTECGGICGQYPHFALNETTCTIDYDGGGAAVLVPVALMLEDHPRQSITLGRSRTVTTSHALSMIPLQFLVKITGSSACNVLPTYHGSTISEDTIVRIPSNGSLNETLSAYASDYSRTIVQFVVIGPVGTLTSDIFSPSFGLYSAFVTWQPTPSQTGKHLICYYAVDSSGKSGKQVCFSVDVATISNPCEVDNGGCNDLCLLEGSVSRCDCSNPCWSLAGDRKTCIPYMNVTCNGNGMDLSIARCASSLTVFAGSRTDYPAQSDCKSVDTSSSHSLSISLSKCGMIIQSNPIVLQFGVDLWIWESFSVETNVITRGEWRKVPVICSLPWSSNLTGSFVPVLPFNDDFLPDEIEISGMGEFSFYFEYYRTNSFSDSYSPADYPIEVTVNDDIFFSLGAYGRGGLVFFTEQCIAMSSSTIETSALTYSFIENGCLLDSTLARYPAGDTMQDKFSIKAFEFEEKLLVSREDAEIFIQCQVMLCDAADNGTRCAQGCSPGSTRRKRNAEIRRSYTDVKTRQKRNDDDSDDDLPELGVAESPLQPVATRFVLIVNPTPSNERSVDSLNASIIWITVALSVAVVATVFIIAYRLVKNRRKMMMSCQNEQKCETYSDIQENTFL